MFILHSILLIVVKARINTEKFNPVLFIQLQSNDFRLRGGIVGLGWGGVSQSQSRNCRNRRYVKGNRLVCGEYQNTHPCTLRFIPPSSVNRLRDDYT